MREICLIIPDVPISAVNTGVCNKSPVRETAFIVFLSEVDFLAVADFWLVSALLLAIVCSCLASVLLFLSESLSDEGGIDIKSSREVINIIEQIATFLFLNLEYFLLFRK